METIFARKLSFTNDHVVSEDSLHKAISNTRLSASKVSNIVIEKLSKSFSSVEKYHAIFADIQHVIKVH